MIKEFPAYVTGNIVTLYTDAAYIKLRLRDYVKGVNCPCKVQQLDTGEFLGITFNNSSYITPVEEVTLVLRLTEPPTDSVNL